MNDSKHDLREQVMASIKKSGIVMKPRWHFVLLSTLLAAGVLIVLVTLLYITSLAVFFLRESGAWYATGFGARGWFELLRSAPITLLALIAFFAIVLELLVRKYSFAYRTPLVMSLGGILVIVLVGGFALAQTSLHHQLAFQARHGQLPPPMGIWYGMPFRQPPPGDMYRGVIVTRTPPDEGVAPTSFIIVSDRDGTSTVLLTPRTRFPYGEDFGRGDTVIVIGDNAGTGTIRAFGMRQINEEQ